MALKWDTEATGDVLSGYIAVVTLKQWYVEAAHGQKGCEHRIKGFYCNNQSCLQWEEKHAGRIQQVLCHFCVKNVSNIFCIVSTSKRRIINFMFVLF